ncbi:hypothetical protein OH76DRAFT_685636 [Lentinus brumalis]|uniref:Uncharacterized protein n=1 Tax=Lentinus brumalis TaxID=2498619 RepID=A0A371D6T2_9APHY|nr:hypothetical protein OH76DRAFT_685636 [Polyporus brumalis]
MRAQGTIVAISLNHILCSLRPRSAQSIFLGERERHCPDSSRSVTASPARVTPSPSAAPALLLPQSSSHPRISSPPIPPHACPRTPCPGHFLQLARVRPRGTRRGSHIYPAPVLAAAAEHSHRPPSEAQPDVVTCLFHPAPVSFKYCLLPFHSPRSPSLT